MQACWHILFTFISPLPGTQGSESEVAQSCPTLCDPVDSSLHQAPPSMGFSRQEYWSGLPLLSPGNLPNPGIKPRSLTLYTDALPSEPPGKSNVWREQVKKSSCHLYISPSIMTDNRQAEGHQLCKIIRVHARPLLMGPLPWGGKGLRGQVPRSSSNSIGSPEAMATHSGPAYPRRGCGAPGQGWGVAGARSAQLWGHRHFLLGEAALGGGQQPRGFASCSHSGGGSVRSPSGVGATFAVALRCLCGPKWDLGQRVEC